MRTSALLLVLVCCTCPAVEAADLSVDERPGGRGDWGFRPAEGETTRRTPPSLSVRPQKNAATYSFEIARDPEFAQVAYTLAGHPFNVHCPSRALAEGRYHWRFRFTDRKGRTSAWSRTRAFVVAKDAAVFVLPPREEVIKRVPAGHPRLFTRPEDLEGQRAPTASESDAWGKFHAKCDKLLASPPPTAEPKKYPAGTVRGSDPWRAIWWGNRRHTIRLLEGAANLAFAWRNIGLLRYGKEAKRLLLAAAAWDPRGSTGYRYNDEAGMPYAYHFSRAYTFLHPVLSKEERETCQRVMRVRGKEMYAHLCPRHFWRPYGSHQNRAWHFLGEVGIAFLGEIPEAEDWLWFAVNVFANVYPVWCDEDGGWSEGLNYWSSYVGRFTWWADVMKRAVGLDAYTLPYFSQAGYYPMYLMPPGTRGGGFGDLNAKKQSRHMRGIMTVLATQSRNAHWQWYVEAIGGPQHPNDFVGVLRASEPPPKSHPPTDLPTSRLFAGTGLAVLNTNLLDAQENVSVQLKASPFGTQSHGYESQNSFLLYAYGRRLLIRSGYRDSYGSKHHRLWMWQTKSTNCITVNGEGQRPHSQSAVGRISDFHTSKHVHYAQGEAAKAYGGNVKRFTRGILLVKPNLVVIHDRLETERDSAFEWHLHTPVPVAAGWRKHGCVRIRNESAACWVEMMAPADLEFSLTDAFAPPPRSRIKLTEYHLSAKTPTRSRAITFVTVLRPHRSQVKPPSDAYLERIPGGYILRASWLGDGRRATILLRDSGQAPLAGGGLRTDGDVAVALLDDEGKHLALYAAGGASVRAE